MCQSVISIESTQHFAAEHRVPRERDVDALRGQERAIGRHEPFDDEVLEDELAVEEADTEPADVHRPADALRALALGERRADPGPRSTVSVATIATASVTANTATPSFVKRNAKCDRMRSKRLNLSGTANP